MIKVLLVHNSYQQRGGEDTVVAAERGLLETNGIATALHKVSNNAISGPTERAAAMLRVRRNPREIDNVVRRAREWQADVVHVHNFFPLVSPGAHVALAEAGFPVVQTLHNYRLLCANGLFLREGAVCEDCLQGSSFNAVRHACYRESRFGSAAVVAMQRASIGNREWRNSVARFIALTSFQRAKMIAGGLAPEKVTVKANSVADPGPRSSSRTGALYVGRLSPEKGLDTLIAAFAGTPDVPLTIVGDGPERARGEAAASANVAFAGSLSRDEVIARMKSAAFLILPSIWYEGFPMTLVEAFACGLPVIASRIGGIPEIVEHGSTGYLFEPGNAVDLAATVRRAFSDSECSAQMGLKARERFEVHYAPEVNFRMLYAIYDSVIASQALPHG